MYKRIVKSLAALAAAIAIKKYLLTSDPDEPKSASVLSRRRAVRSLRLLPGLNDAIPPLLPLPQFNDGDGDDDDGSGGGADKDDDDNEVDTGVDLLALLGLLPACLSTSIADAITATISTTISTNSITTVNKSIIYSQIMHVQSIILPLPLILLV